MPGRRKRRAKPIEFFPRFTQPAREQASIPIDFSFLKTARPLSVTLEETEDLTTWKTPKAKPRRRRRRPAG